MKKINNLNELANNSIQYAGVLEKYQIQGSDQNGIKYQHYKLNEYQNMLYKRAILGLKLYSKDEKKKMHWEKRKRIDKVSKKAQNSINLFKQERVNEMCKVIQQQYFPNCIFAGFILSSDQIKTDPEFINNLELKSLGITRKLVIGKFIKEGILPNNFYHLKETA